MIPKKIVPLHPLFGVIAGRKYREACYVALERYNKFNYRLIKMDLIKVAEEAFATGKKFPEFKAGDTITVAYKIIEGSKERIQLYRGVVIKISGHEDKKRFTVRKMSGTVGVERIFRSLVRLPVLRRSATTLVNKKSNKERFHNRSLSFYL